MLTRTGATLVAMAAVEAETLGWQKQGGVPQKGRARDQHRSHLTGRARAEDPVSRHRPRSLLTRRLLRLGHRGTSQPPPQPKHPPRHTREEQAGGPRQPKPTPTSSRPTSFAQSCYEQDERWASGGYPSTPPWDMPDDPPRASGPKKGAATSRETAGSGDASPPESRPDNTWGWACNLCGRENHLLKGRCGGCQEVKTAQALPVAATHWRCPRCGEENRTARPACHGCFKPRTGKVELLRTAPSDDPRQSAHETSTSATSSWTTPATSSTGPTSSTASGTPPTASPPAGGAGRRRRRQRPSLPPDVRSSQWLTLWSLVLALCW